MNAETPKMHPFTVSAFALLTVVALVPVSTLVLAPGVAPVDVAAVDAGPVDTGALHWGAAATPNHDPNRRRTTPSPALVPVTALIEATALNPSAEFPPPPVIPVTVLAEPESATPSAPAFVATDRLLYAKDNARLRAAPDTASDVLAKLTADTELRAVARSTDGGWWRVSLVGGRIGYVHRTAVTRNRVVTLQPPTAPAVIVADAPLPPAAPRRNQGLLDYVDDTMTWLVDAAGGGSAPPTVRPEH
jgi:hypothetical protein